MRWDQAVKVILSLHFYIYCVVFFHGVWIQLPLIWSHRMLTRYLCIIFFTTMLCCIWIIYIDSVRRSTTSSRLWFIHVWLWYVFKHILFHPPISILFLGVNQISFPQEVGVYSDWGFPSFSLYCHTSFFPLSRGLLISYPFSFYTT